jgi:hypothetical protein
MFALAKLAARNSTNGHAMRTPQTPDDLSSCAAPAGHRTDGSELAGVTSRLLRLKRAPARSALVVFAVLWALAGAAVTAQAAGASPVRSATALAAPSGQVFQSARSTAPKNVSASIVEAIVKHPCKLLTMSEADAAASTRFATEYDLPATGLCEYVANPSNNSTINVYVQLGAVAADLPPKFANSFTPEPSLGNGVVWVVEKGGQKGSGELWFPLGKVGSASYSVQVEIARGGLAEASTIARDCFSHM